MFCLTVIQLTKMKIDSKHIITSEIVRIKQLFLSHVTFLSFSQVSVVYNISSSYANTNLSNGCVSHKQFLISKYLPILHGLLLKQSHVLGFHIKSFLEFI